MIFRMQWKIGCSGFSYREWKEIFYPKGLPQRLWFDHYAKHFDTLELNVTFYRFPTLPTMEGWYEKAPPGFTFSAKMPKAVTHLKKFRNTSIMVQDFYDVLKEGLKEKLGPVLIQLPPSFTYDQEQLELMLQQIDSSVENVIEFRNESWWRGDVMTALAKHNVSFCGVSFPGIVHDEAVINRSLVYYRFHGFPKLFHSAYTEDFLKEKIAEISSNEGAREVYLLFNNTASAAALSNARFVQAYLCENSLQSGFQR